MSKLLRVPTPDDHVWPVTLELHGAFVEAGHVKVVWADSRESKFHALWLRDNCACAECTHPVTHEQQVDLLAIPHDVTVGEAVVAEDGTLRVRFEQDGHLSVFHPGWLSAHCFDLAPHRPAPERVLWNAGDLGEPPTFSGPAAMDCDDTLYEVLSAICRYGIARVRDLPVTENTVERFAYRIGPIRESHFERVFNVVSRPDADSNAYTSAALPAHADMPTRETPHGLQLLHCLAAEASGGQSVMVDGFRVAEDMRRLYPADFENLATVKWTYANRSGESDYRWTTPHFLLDEDGELEEVRLASFSRAPLLVDFDRIEPSYDALRRYLGMTYADEYRLVFPFKAGDLVAFDNRRVLHARTAFDPATGRRHLQGTYVDRDDLMSTLRILERRRVCAAA
jgi:gamma-butyrobetaine dioxygenase